jgi:tetratricopeptide (TPR) repeat protein
MNRSFPLDAWRGLLVALAATALLVRAAEPEPAPRAAARKLLLEGKHDEAREAYQALEPKHPVAAALGIARAQEATGHREEAVKTLAAAAKKDPKSPLPAAELARLALNRGDYKEAEAEVAASLALDPQDVLAHLVRAELRAASGKLAAANDDYQWLVNYYNDHDALDSETLHWIGLGASQFARWNRLTDQFRFLVNDFYPDLVAAEPAFWRAHYEAGALFSEKYNDAEAAKEFKAALALNPNAAEVHAALGQLALDGFELAAAQAACDQALAINPQLLAAHHLKADIHLANFEPRQSAGVLKDALALDPVSEATLGRLAAAYLAVDGTRSTAPDSRFGKLVAEVNARNPHAGEFYLALADALDRLRRWPAAAGYYREAMTRMPQLVAPSGRLGMMLMRLGDEAEARKVLDESFQADPFNVRVKNTLEVLDVLDGYETLETEHFRIRFDPKKDKLLARAMGQWLEGVHPQLVAQMGFTPPGKSLFEIFCRARNTDGHGWFSARMVGLPRIHPIGACAGKIVALQSPTEGQQRFNWARVVKHEFIHLINLQQTDFNIPHWFTEALAVLNEGYPRPQEWNELLSKRFAADRLFNLDSINLGFIRPHSSDDWTLAYCQAELYAEYMLERFGKDAIARMLAAYADNLTTSEALQRALGVAQGDFERGYREFVTKIVKALPPAAAGEPSLVELQKALAAKPKDPQLLAQMAQARLNRRGYPEARKLADAALAADPKNQLAHYVRARLHLLVGENKEALARLEESLDRQHPQDNHLALLAGLKLRADDFAAAAELYELGANANPHSATWLKSLAAVYLKSGDEKKLAPILEKLAESDPDDLTVRKKLAQLAVAANNWPAADRWATEALHIQVIDPELHAWRAESLASQGNAAAAADEFATAIELDPDQPKWRLSLAAALVKSDRRAEAKTALEELLKREPDNADAKKLLETLP